MEYVELINRGISRVGRAGELGCCPVARLAANAGSTSLGSAASPVPSKYGLSIRTRSATSRILRRCLAMCHPFPGGIGPLGLAFFHSAHLVSSIQDLDSVAKNPCRFPILDCDVLLQLLFLVFV